MVNKNGCFCDERVVFILHSPILLREHCALSRTKRDESFINNILKVPTIKASGNEIAQNLLSPRGREVSPTLQMHNQTLPQLVRTKNLRKFRLRGRNNSSVGGPEQYKQLLISHRGDFTPFPPTTTNHFSRRLKVFPTLKRSVFVLLLLLQFRDPSSKNF